jgi:hypothetical protein
MTPAHAQVLTIPPTNANRARRQQVCCSAGFGTTKTTDNSSQADSGPQAMSLPFDPLNKSPSALTPMPVSTYRGVAVGSENSAWSSASGAPAVGGQNVRAQFRDQVVTTAQGVGVVAWVGFAIGSAYLGLVVLILAGSTLTDPGGWLGIGLTAAWLLPTLALAVLALLRPSAAVPVLAILTLMPVGMGFWSLVDYQGARDWEDHNGPISLVLLIVVAAGLLLLGLALPTTAGVLLLIATVAPSVLALIGAGDNWFEPLSISLVTAPLVAAGVLYVVAGTRRPSTSNARPGRPLSTRPPSAG